MVIISRDAVLGSLADNRTNHWSFLNFSRILRQYQNYVKRGKFHSSAQNSMACGKLWALLMMHNIAYIRHIAIAAAALFHSAVSYGNSHKQSCVNCCSGISYTRMPFQSPK